MKRASWCRKEVGEWKGASQCGVGEPQRWWGYVVGVCCRGGGEGGRGMN